MSVLFKALEKAQRGRIDADRAAAATPKAMPGVPVGKPTRPERGRGLLRALGVVAMACLGATVTAMFLYADDIERMLIDGVTPPAPPAAVVAPTPDPSAENTPTEAESAEQSAPPALPDGGPTATSSKDDFADDIARSLSAPVSPKSNVQLNVQPEPPATTNLAELMATARAVRAGTQSPPAPASSTPSEDVPPKDAANEPPPRTTVEESLEQRARTGEALALRPPVAVERRAAQNTGAPDAVQVTVPTVQTRDTISSAYRALLRGEYHAALAGYEEVLTDDPRNLQALLGQGAALHKLRRLDEAREAYEHVLALDGSNREALTNLLSILGTAAPQEALERLLDLQRQAPDFGPVAAQVGLAYAALGQTVAAIAQLEKSVTLEPSNLLYRYNFAVVQDQAGQRKKAAVNYRAVLDGLRRGNSAGGSLDARQVQARLNYLSTVR